MTDAAPALSGGWEWMHEVGFGRLDEHLLMPPGVQIPENVLWEADRLTRGDRNESYGHPAEDFARIAALWTVILGVDVTAHDVGLCLIALKVARECHVSKRDNLTDIAGYARCIEMIGEQDGAVTRAPRGVAGSP